MRYRPGKKRSPLQEAASRHNWRLVQAKGCKAFLESIGLPQVAKIAYEAAVTEIELLWEKEKELASKS